MNSYGGRFMHQNRFHHSGMPYHGKPLHDESTRSVAYDSLLRATAKVLHDRSSGQFFVGASGVVRLDLVYLASAAPWLLKLLAEFPELGFHLCSTALSEGVMTTMLSLAERDSQNDLTDAEGFATLRAAARLQNEPVAASGAASPARTVSFRDLLPSSTPSADEAWSPPLGLVLAVAAADGRVASPNHLLEGLLAADPGATNFGLAACSFSNGRLVSGSFLVVAVDMLTVQRSGKPVTTRRVFARPLQSTPSSLSATAPVLELDTTIMAPGTFDDTALFPGSVIDVRGYVTRLPPPDASSAPAPTTKASAYGSRGVQQDEPAAPRIAIIEASLLHPATHPAASFGNPQPRSSNPYVDDASPQALAGHYAASHAAWCALTSLEHLAGRVDSFSPAAAGGCASLATAAHHVAALSTLPDTMIAAACIAALDVAIQRSRLSDAAALRRPSDVSASVRNMRGSKRTPPVHVGFFAPQNTVTALRAMVDGLVPTISFAHVAPLASTSAADVSKTTPLRFNGGVAVSSHLGQHSGAFGALLWVNHADSLKPKDIEAITHAVRDCGATTTTSSAAPRVPPVILSSDLSVTGWRLDPKLQAWTRRASAALSHEPLPAAAYAISKHAAETMEALAARVDTIPAGGVLPSGYNATLAVLYGLFHRTAWRASVELPPMTRGAAMLLEGYFAFARARCATVDASLAETLVLLAQHSALLAAPLRDWGAPWAVASHTVTADSVVAIAIADDTIRTRFGVSVLPFAHPLRTFTRGSVPVAAVSDVDLEALRAAHREQAAAAIPRFIECLWALFAANSHNNSPAGH
jgi:hypothetical protein